MNKLNKTVCLPPDVLAGIEAYREKLAKPTPSFSKTLEQVIRAGLPVVEKKLADVK